MVSKELSDCDIVDIWETGLKKPVAELKGIAQYRLPSGMIRLVYELRESVDLALFIRDPFFNYRKSILGII